MKLLYSPTSPYARKVRVVAREKGLLDRLMEVQSLPAEKPEELLAANPLGKVPALVLDDGGVLFDSPVICEYLDQLAPGSLLVPVGLARWPVLKAQALADGVMDVAVAAVMESRRPAERQSATNLEHYRTQIKSGVSHMHRELGALNSALSLGHIAAAVALAYLDFRLPDFCWREDADQSLIDWYTDFSERQSMLETAPPV